MERAVPRFNPLVFLKEVQSELLKVSWPSRPQAIRLTLIVIAVSVIVALYIGGLDYLFTNLVTLLVKK
jgi:preprotein translocase subunit SecE